MVKIKSTPNAKHKSARGGIKKPGAPSAAMAPFAAIPLSKRANILFLERAKVVQKDGRVLYLSQKQDDTLPDGRDIVDEYFNIPQHNTSLLLLGQGTSISDSAMRLLSDANVMVGFTGSGGSPLHSAVDPVFFSPQGEYRPTEYMQAWMRMWLDDEKRLKVAKSLLMARMEWAQESWSQMRHLGKLQVSIDDSDMDRFESQIKKASNTTELLSAEGTWVKSLYVKLAKGHKIHDFNREERTKTRSSQRDVVNGMLTHGNYIAYGFAAVALHALGISFALPVLHGKTRRGALVFDIADIFKDATVLPTAFLCASEGMNEQQHRNSLIEAMRKAQVIDRAIETIKKHAV
jgi:CRISPR-associated protein Cas1